MELIYIKQNSTWDSFVTNQKTHTFLHSWAWGEFNKNMGDKVWRFGVYNENELIAVMLLIKVHSRAGNFLFVPHGPISISGEKCRMQNAKCKSINKKSKILEIFTEKFKEIAKQENVNFIRISPLLKRTEKNAELFKNLGYKKAPRYMHAENTWKLKLDKTEEDLLMDMRKNTRNLVRRAEKERVEIVSGTTQEFIDEFLKLYKETAKKHNFTPFSKKYIEEEIKNFAKYNNALVYLAKWQKKILSSAIIIFYGNSAFYHQGANSLENTKIPAAYLLQWQVIKDAKEHGKQFYNFWGVAEDEKNKKHPWHGLTFFKTGFGGYRVNYLEAQDLKLNSKYFLNYLYDKYVSWKRGV